jgi:nitroreductase
MNYLEALSRRYSVKKFNHEIIPQETLHNILESGKLSASSLGLQPYEILIVESEEMKQKLIPAFYNPSQISTCSHLIVIVSKKIVDDNYINGYFRHISKVRETPLENWIFLKTASISILIKKHRMKFSTGQKNSLISFWQI